MHSVASEIKCFSKVLNHFLTCLLLSGDDPSKVPSNDADDINLGDDFTAVSKKQKKTTEDIPSSEDSSDDSEDKFVGSLTLNQPKRSKVESGHVTLQCTLAFCYLGLLWINEPVFVSDLVRYVLRHCSLRMILLKVLYM